MSNYGHNTIKKNDRLTALIRRHHTSCDNVCWWSDSPMVMGGMTGSVEEGLALTGMGVVGPFTITWPGYERKNRIICQVHKNNVQERNNELYKQLSEAGHMFIELILVSVKWIIKYTCFKNHKVVLICEDYLSEQNVFYCNNPKFNRRLPKAGSVWREPGRC